MFGRSPAWTESRPTLEIHMLLPLIAAVLIAVPAGADTSGGAHADGRAGAALAHTLLRDGEAAYGERDFERAAELLRSAARLVPDSVFNDPAYVWDLLGRTLYRLDQHIRAEEALRQALELNPRNPDHYTHLGLVLTARDRLDDAAATYFAALAIDPSHLQARYNLGFIYQRTQQFPLAMMQFRRVKAEYPEFMPARLAIAVVLRAQNQYAEAHEELSAAIARDSTFTGAWVERGFLNTEWRRLDNAESDFRHVLNADPAHARARYGLGLCYTYQRKWVAAQQQADSLVSVDPELARRLQSIISR